MNFERKAAFWSRQRKDTPMRDNHKEKDESKGIFYEGLEGFAREKQHRLPEVPEVRKSECCR